MTEIESHWYNAFVDWFDMRMLRYELESTRSINVKNCSEIFVN